MKKTKLLLILLFAFFLISCNQKEVNELKNRVAELESVNSKLYDSISDVKYQKVMSANIIGISSKPILKIGEKEKVKFIFNYPEKLLSYDVYTSTPDGKPDEMILQNLTDNEFEYEFIPNVIGEQKVQLIAVFRIDNNNFVEIAIPTNTGFKTTD